MSKKENKIKAIAEALGKKFKERQDLIRGMLTALLAREMLFMLGTPGTAKSAICDALCGAVGGKYFSWLMSKFTTPEEVFGPLSLKALEHDKYERVVEGKLPEANIAFLDEIFKGSSAILNTLLPIINERIFYNGSSPTKIPLQVLFSASNEIPQAEELAALYDRFALRYDVPRIQSDAMARELFDEIANAKSRVKIPTITLEELKSYQKEVDEMVIPDKILDILVELRRSVEKEGIFTSDRRWVQCIRVLKAYAYLNDNSEVTEDDLDILCNVLWSVPDQIKPVRKLVNKFANPLGEQIIELTDAVQEIADLLDKGEIHPVEGHKKIKNAKKTLEGLGDRKKNHKLDDAIKTTQQTLVMVCKKHLGLDDE